MKKVILTILTAFLITLFVVSCEKDDVNNDIQQSIEKNEIKEGDI